MIIPRQWQRSGTAALRITMIALSLLLLGSNSSPAQHPPDAKLVADVQWGCVSRILPPTNGLGWWGPNAHATYEFTFFGPTGNFGFTHAKAANNPEPSMDGQWNWWNAAADFQCHMEQWVWSSGSIDEFHMSLLLGSEEGYERVRQGDGSCDYQFEFDPTTCDPTSDPGTGGGSTPPPGNSGGGSDPMCTDLTLTPGRCYDVYIDDVYDKTICC